MTYDYNNYTNAEIKIKMLEMENKYEVLKKKLTEIISEMNNIDKNYSEAKKIIEKRSKGIL